MNIEFSAHPSILLLKDIRPIPAKKFIPDWFKKVPIHGTEKMTIKGCVPVLDSINAGYLLRLSQDFSIEFNIQDLNSDKKTTTIRFASPLKYLDVKFGENDRYMQSNPEAHPASQLDGDNGFMATKNGMNHFFKIVNPWKIKTPPGYSCLFIPPMHREFDHFHILPGIVDTDQHVSTVNFPICINKSKYPSFKKVFEKGLPYVQVIPFKRDSWKMSISNIIQEEDKLADFKTTLLNWYKKKSWSKKIFE
jgi:hypothetical protein